MDYQHRPHPRAKHLKISVETDGSVIVSSPPGTSIKQIDKLVQEKTAWIEQQQAKIRQRSFIPVTEQHLWLFGQKFKLIKQPTQTAKGQIQKNTGEIILKFTPKILNNPQTIIAELNQFFKETARAYLEPRTQHLALKLDVKYQRLFLREQKTRWGSCSGKNNLNFNWRLVHFAPAVIDYVIVHELAHLKHRNHSKKFWELVSQFDPEYQNHRQWLKSHLIATDS